MSFKQNFKKKFGVTPAQVVERFSKYMEGVQEFKFLSQAKRREDFNWDPSALDPYKEYTLPTVQTDVIGENTLLQRFTLEEGVKGTREITILEATLALQEVQGCDATPDGSVAFTGVDISTKLLYAGIEFCNETLNGKATQILNSLGVKGQNDHIPYEIEQILMAYLTKLLQRSVQDLLLLGDTTSSNPNLAIADGLVKKWDADGNIYAVAYPSNVINQTNAYSIAEAMVNAINPELYASGEKIILLTGSDVLRYIAMEYNRLFPYTTVNVELRSSNNSILFPHWGVEVFGTMQLAAKSKMYIVPERLVYVATDEMDDMEFDVKYQDYEDRLKVEAKFRLGWQYIFPIYFAKLNLTGLPPNPVITTIAPDNGDAGDLIVLTGSNFNNASAVKFGTTNATAFTLLSSTQIEATVPTGLAAGAVNVTVVTPGGTSVAKTFTIN